MSFNGLGSVTRAGVAASTMIQWPEILETGYPEIDGDHRRLVEACNGLTRLAGEHGSRTRRSTNTWKSN